jgi:hypothetical protein
VQPVVIGRAEGFGAQNSDGGGLWPGDAFFLNGLSIRK